MKALERICSVKFHGFNCCGCDGYLLCAMQYRHCDRLPDKNYQLHKQKQLEKQAKKKSLQTLNS